MPLPWRSHPRNHLLLGVDLSQILNSYFSLFACPYHFHIGKTCSNGIEGWWIVPLGDLCCRHDLAQSRKPHCPQHLGVS